MQRRLSAPCPIHKSVGRIPASPPCSIARAWNRSSSPPNKTARVTCSLSCGQEDWEARNVTIATSLRDLISVTQTLADVRSIVISSGSWALFWQCGRPRDLSRVFQVVSYMTPQKNLLSPHIAMRRSDARRPFDPILSTDKDAHKMKHEFG